MAEEQKIINRHLLAEVFKICHTCEIKADQAKMSNARVVLANITNRFQILTTPMKDRLLRK